MSCPKVKGKPDPESCARVWGNNITPVDHHSFAIRNVRIWLSNRHKEGIDSNAVLMAESHKLAEIVFSLEGNARRRKSTPCNKRPHI